MNKSADKFKAAGVEVIAVFREEKKGVEGLEIIKKLTKTDSTLALDMGNKQTPRYSPQKRDFSSYVVDKQGVIREIIKGDLRNRANSEQLLEAVSKFSKSADSSGSSDASDSAGSKSKQGSGKSTGG